MKKYQFFLILFYCAFYLQHTSAQSNEKLGFYFIPEYSAMLLENHIGNAVGFNVGVSSKNRKWHIGLRYYGRSGPINEHIEYPLELQNGQEYKGKSVVNLGADHGYLGLEGAYNLFLNNGKIQLRFPVSVGQLGAGFYLKGEDRITPDGRRVSEWEDDIQEGEDAGFGISTELGASIYFQPVESLPQLKLGTAIHFANTFGYRSFLGGDDYYNNKVRLSLGLNLGF
ncbi:MAG: hypothetical protein AAF806_18395 [Bacteroidota bacterium]